MQANLIIAEGLPGSGKSTAAAMIAEELKRAGYKVLCKDEGEAGHPADYADYDFAGFAEEREKILAKWRDFVSDADRGTVYVFNCIYLQNPMCETMMRFGMSEAESLHYISEITEIIRPLHPLIVYLDQPDPKAAIDRVRSARGSAWLDMVIAYHTEQGYGRQNGLSGYDGYIRCLAERRRREMRILMQTGIRYRTVSGFLQRAVIPALLAAAGIRREEIMLRPHHLLCIQKFTGHGYDAAFTAHMESLCGLLRELPDTPVTLHSGADDLCAACPHCRGGLCDAQEKVTALDAAVSAHCRLPDSSQPWRMLAETVRMEILETPAFHEICARCQWYALCNETGGFINGTDKTNNPHT